MYAADRAPRRRIAHSCLPRVRRGRELTEALEDLKTTALEVRLREREASKAAEDLKQQLKEVRSVLRSGFCAPPSQLLRSERSALAPAHRARARLTER